MSALTNIMANIYLTIPGEILDMTFREFKDTALSIDEHIRQRIIIPIVIPRVNSVCGMPKHIELLDSYIEHTTSESPLYSPVGGTLYRIPLEARDNREIIEVRKLTGHPYAGDFVSPNNIVTMQNDLLASFTYGDNSLTLVTPILKEGNIILIRPNVLPAIGGVFCETVLGFDNYFTGLERFAELPLTNYVTAIVKAYIRNQLIIKVEQGELLGGMQTGRVREIIDQYENDSNLETQQNLLQTLRGSVSVMSKENFSSYLRHAL